MNPNDEICFEDLGAQTDANLAADGWKRRHLADPARTSESIELYQAMGFEVHVHKLTPDDFADSCAQCASVVCKNYVLIYTRKLI